MSLIRELRQQQHQQQQQVAQEQQRREEATQGQLAQLLADKDGLVPQREADIEASTAQFRGMMEEIGKLANPMQWMTASSAQIIRASQRKSPQTL